MTAREAIAKGIRLVRLPNWNAWTYLKLPELRADGTHGPWAYLYDPISACVLQNHGEAWSFPQASFFPDWADDENRFLGFTGVRLTPDDIRANRHITSDLTPQTPAMITISGVFDGALICKPQYLDNGSGFLMAVPGYKHGWVRAANFDPIEITKAINDGKPRKIILIAEDQQIPSAEVVAILTKLKGDTIKLVETGPQ